MDHTDRYEEKKKKTIKLTTQVVDDRLGHNSDSGTILKDTLHYCESIINMCVNVSVRYVDFHSVAAV